LFESQPLQQSIKSLSIVPMAATSLKITYTKQHQNNRRTILTNNCIIVLCNIFLITYCKVAQFKKYKHNIRMPFLCSHFSQLCGHRSWGYVGSVR
jgi:hypothetical protein